MSLNFGNMWTNTKKNNSNINSNTSNHPIRNQKFLQNRIKINKPTNHVVKKENVMGTKGYWGEPTWLLFHSLAEKANPEKYKKHYIVVWNFIKEVCNGLPCPYCKQHATNYVSRIPVYHVNTKEKLKETLYNFHNDVNRRTGKISLHTSVLEKYKRSNINKILEIFMSRFFVSYIGTRHFNDWLKNQLKEKTKTFWNFYVKNVL